MVQQIYLLPQTENDPAITVPAFMDMEYMRDPFLFLLIFITLTPLLAIVIETALAMPLTFKRS